MDSMLPVCLFSNRSQMMSKCGKNKKVAYEPLGKCVVDVVNELLGKCVTDVLTT